jgi:outer membrane protein assembly factor BamB
LLLQDAQDRMASTRQPGERKALRLWPGVVLVVVQWLAWFGTAIVLPEATPWGMTVAIFAAPAVVLWWLFFSRAPWSERVGALVLMVAALAAEKRVVHESIASGGMGMLLYIYALPFLGLALVAGAAAGQRLPRGQRWATLIGAILLPCGVFTLLRTGGITGEGDSDLHWRWTATPEERLLTQTEDEPQGLPVPAEERTGAEWSGFRGPERDGIARGVQIATDWSRSPPTLLWRRPIGPGWSSFAAHGELAYTQEQRGEHEVVACYRLTTGEPVWRHRDPVRFWESNGGAGPRGTPSLRDGRVYTLGATGIVNALDARSGAVVWSRNAATDTGQALPEWGFASSPLLLDDLVVVALAGELAAYDAATGDLRWLGPARGTGYSSPHRATIDGVPQILLLSGGDVASFAPADGSLLWEHAWQAGTSIVQPALTANGEILITAAYEMGGMGVRRIAASRTADGWTVEERWTSRALKAYFNDRRPRGPCLRLRQQHPRVHRPRGRRAQVEGWALRARPGRPATRPGPVALAVGGGRAGAGRGDARGVHGARSFPGARGQDLEPPGPGRRRPAGAQRRGDGGVPAVPGALSALSCCARDPLSFTRVKRVLRGGKTVWTAPEATK